LSIIYLHKSSKEAFICVRHFGSKKVALSYRLPDYSHTAIEVSHLMIKTYLIGLKFALDLASVKYHSLLVAIKQDSYEALFYSI